MKRATIYFDDQIHRALKLKAASADIPISKLVEDAVRISLSEDEEDLRAIAKRRREPNLDFATFVKQLKRRGKI